MAKKAKLDILEISVTGSNETVPKGDELTANNLNEAPTEAISRESYFSQAVRWFFRPFFLIILIVIALLGSTTYILMVYYQGTGREVISSQNKGSISVTPLQEAKKAVLIEGMIVDQKDASGNIRLVFCDVALDFEQNQSASSINGDRVDIRSLIYSLLQKEMAEEGLSSEGRKRLKEKIKNELNGFFRENLVKEVYFTRYELH